MSQRISIVDYGMGNLRSVEKALAHVAPGAEVAITARPEDIRAADRVVFPGQGAMPDCMRCLRESGLGEAVAEAARAKPFLGLCIGQQMLFEGSEEDPDAGLSLLTGTIRRIPDAAVKVPHMGWNEVRWTADHPFVSGIPTGTRFYFVHSYAAHVDPIYTVGQTDHAVSFASVVASGSVFATQFHPEKSGEPGLAIYESFVKEVGAA